MRYTGSIVGRDAEIELSGATISVAYGHRGMLHWTRTDQETGFVTKGTENFGYLQLSETLHFISWKDRSGFTVSHLIDTDAGTVSAVFSYPKSTEKRGHKVFEPTLGTFKII